jgi:hypothetical protein
MYDWDTLGGFSFFLIEENEQVILWISILINFTGASISYGNLDYFADQSALNTLDIWKVSD